MIKNHILKDGSKIAIIGGYAPAHEASDLSNIPCISGGNVDRTGDGPGLVVNLRQGDRAIVTTQA